MRGERMHTAESRLPVDKEIQGHAGITMGGDWEGTGEARCGCSLEGVRLGDVKERE
jgi:hypothetical protein